MEAPLGITFLKKVEIYQRIASWRKNREVLDKDPHAGGQDATWPLEEKILRWAYRGHKHLASPITKSQFIPSDYRESGDLIGKTRVNISTDLLDNKLYKGEQYIRDKVDRTFENLVRRGFATYEIELSKGLDPSKKPKHTAIYFTNDGLLVGEVLNELNSIVRQICYKFFGML